MPGKTIGIDLEHGFAGCYSRHFIQETMTRPNNDTTDIVFGAPLMKDGNGVINVTAAFTAEDFVGVAAATIKTQFNYTDYNAGGSYAPFEPVGVFQRGSIQVICPDGTPETNGAVYIRTVENGDLPVGSFSANNVSGETVLLPNCRWNGAKDSRNVVELVILTRNNA